MNMHMSYIQIGDYVAIVEIDDDEKLNTNLWTNDKVSGLRGYVDSIRYFIDNTTGEGKAEILIKLDKTSKKLLNIKNHKYNRYDEIVITNPKMIQVIN